MQGKAGAEGGWGPVRTCRRPQEGGRVSTKACLTKANKGVGREQRLPRVRVKKPNGMGGQRVQGRRGWGRGGGVLAQQRWPAGVAHSRSAGGHTSPAQQPYCLCCCCPVQQRTSSPPQRARPTSAYLSCFLLVRVVHVVVFVGIEHARHLGQLGPLRLRLKGFGGGVWGVGCGGQGGKKVGEGMPGTLDRSASG